MIKTFGKRLPKKLDITNIGNNFHMIEAQKKIARTLNKRLIKDSLIYRLKHQQKRV